MLADVLPLDQHVGLADGVALRVQLLAEHDQLGLVVVLPQVFVGDRQHAARAGGGIVDRAHHAGLRQHLVILDEEQVHHQPDDLARREVLAGRLVGQLGEPADQLLEDEAHLLVADLVRVQVDAGEPLGHLIEQLGLVEPVDLGRELEALEDVADVLREALDVGEEVRRDVVLVADQAPHVEPVGVVEGEARLPEQERLGVHALLRLGLELGQRRVLGRLQDAVEPAEHRERQDDLAVVGLLVVPPQQVRDRPDERRQCLLVH